MRNEERGTRNEELASIKAAKCFKRVFLYNEK